MLWLKRKLKISANGYTVDISEWTTQEREQLINKNQVWKKPDYQQMYDSGTPREVVYFIKKIRDSLPAKPARASEEYQKGYIDFIGYFRDKAMELQTTAEIERFHQDAVLTSPYVKDEGMYHYPRYSATPEAYGCMTNKFFKTAQSSLSSVQSEIRRKEFLYSEDEKLLKSYHFFSYNGSNAYSDENQKGRDGKPAVVFQKGCSKWYLHSQSDDFRNPKDWQENTYIAVKGSEIVGIDFPSIEDAQKSALEHERENQKENPAPEQTRKKGKQKLTPPQLSHIQRDGCDYREGADAVENNYLKELGFRGVQFGNWENQNDRQTNMNMAYDAMKDLAEVLNISDSDVSLGNQLALAFGARGSGNAAAHYEPLENVINLTKMSGAGSLAHEWGHALDKFIQENTSSEEAIRKHLEEDIYQRFSDEFIERTKQTLSAQSESCYFATEDKFSIMQSVVQAMKYKTDQDGRKIETDFLKDAQKLDGAFSTSGNQKGSTEKGYWSSDVELFARAFECYVMDKLAEQGMRNDYLCGHAERTLSVQDKKENSHTVHIHPTGEERKAINSEIDKVFEELRELGLMHENTGQSRTQEYIRTDFEIKPKQTKANESHEPELPVEQNQTKQSVQKTTEQPVQENTEEKQSPEEEMVKKEPAVAIHSVQITQSTNDLLKQISSGASPALVNAVIKELDRRIDAEKENVSSEDVEELFQYANINIDFSVDGTAHSYKSSPCEIGGYDRISLTEQVKFDVQCETEILQRHPDSFREQELKAVRDFLIPALEQSEELSKSDKETLDRLFAEYDRQKAQQKPAPEQKHSVLDNAQKARNGSLIVENTQYRFIPKKTYVSTDKETAEKVAEQLLADGTIKFSSAFRPNADNVTFTVSEQDKESLKQTIAEYKQNEKSTPDVPVSDNPAEQQNSQETEPIEKAIEIITNAVQSGEMTEEQDKALALLQKLVENQIISNTPGRQETENIQNSSETASKQLQNTNKTPEKQLSFFDAVPNQEYQPEKPKQEVQLSFLDYIEARQTELDTYRFAAEICLDSTNKDMAYDNPELYEKLAELLTKKFDENLHSSEPVITEQDLQECIEQNQVNTWLAGYVNEVIEENMPKQKQQVQYDKY